jgi:hypothetical protein
MRVVHRTVNRSGKIPHDEQRVAAQAFFISIGVREVRGGFPMGTLPGNAAGFIFE